MVNEIIKSRKSIRSYVEGEKLEKDDIKTILEAAMLAPSAMGKRTWEFIVITNRDKLDEIMAIHPHAQMLKTASAAIIVLGLGDMNSCVPQDCAAATENILLQSTDLGLGTCWCAVYPDENRVEDFRKTFDLDANKTPFNVIALGVPNEDLGSRGYYEENKITWIE